MSFETILLEEKDGIATITFNRPKVFNAYSEQMTQELKQAVKQVGENSANRVLVLKGSGENFMAPPTLSVYASQTPL